MANDRIKFQLFLANVYLCLGFFPFWPKDGNVQVHDLGWRGGWDVGLRWVRNFWGFRVGRDLVLIFELAMRTYQMGEIWGESFTSGSSDKVF